MKKTKLHIPEMVVDFTGRKMKIIKNRAKPLMKYIEGNVLDIGCVGMGSNDILGGEDFIHGELSKKARYLKGIDINYKGVMKMRDVGYNVEYYDAQQPFDVGFGMFDIVVSEENIEHIANLKTYLENIWKHLKPNGLLLITTPNAHCLEYFIHQIFWGRALVNQYHTHYHSKDTIKYLLKTNGFKVIHHEYTEPINWYITNKKGKFLWFFMRIMPSRLGRGMFIVARKQGGKNGK